MKRIYLAFFLLTLISCSTSTKQAPTETERWAAQAANVEIIRDDFGVPHIYGITDADAVFGLLYAQCEDDFNRVERNYIWAIGRLAEVEGEDYLYSDLRARLYMTQAEAIAKYESSPAWLKELCDAFADGINYYLHTHPETKPKLLTRFEPWMPMYFSEGSIGGDIERVSTRKIERFYGAAASNEVSAVYDGLIRLRDDEPRGSNGFALAGERTASGNTMLLINPHTSFFFRGEVHVVSEEGLNAYGAVTWGQFFVYQGFNEKTGWMHTSTGTDIIDEFEESIVPLASGKGYVYGEETRPLDSVQVTLQYKTENGVEEKSFMTYRSHHGPITHANGDKWVATALMWRPVKALEQSFIRTKQSGHEGFRAMMDMRTNSSNNTVYADAEGNIAYYHGNFIPVRDTSFDYTQPVDGSNPATDWNGIHTVDENVFVLNPENGWLQNCNTNPFHCIGENSPEPEDYPVYMASFPQNYREVHALEVLSKAEDMTLDKLIALAYDPYLPGAKLMADGLSNIPVSGNDEKTARDLLANWDGKVSLETEALTIVDYVYKTAQDKIKYFGEGIHYTEKMRYIASTSDNIKTSVFREAVKRLKNDFGSVQVPWSDYNRYQRNDGAIRQVFNDELPSEGVGMASGIYGALASFGARKGSDTKRQYGVAGNSFVAVVEFGDKVKAKSLLAGGQSGDPASPHFDDQVERYINHDFKEVAFYREDVEKRAERRYVPGE